MFCLGCGSTPSCHIVLDVKKSSQPVMTITGSPREVFGGCLTHGDSELAMLRKMIAQREYMYFLKARSFGSSLDVCRTSDCNGSWVYPHCIVVVFWSHGFANPGLFGFLLCSCCCKSLVVYGNNWSNLGCKTTTNSRESVSVSCLRLQLYSLLPKKRTYYPHNLDMTYETVLPSWFT